LPGLLYAAAAPDRIRPAQADVTVKTKVMPRHSAKKKVVIKHRRHAVFAATRRAGRSSSSAVRM
jgi:hypothetical protein